MPDPVASAPVAMGSTQVDPAAQRQRAAENALTVTKIAGTLAIIGRVVPGPVGKVIAFFAVGAEKDPTTGKLRPGEGTVGIFAPSPIGFSNPEVFGLPKNFYLLPGTTEVVPRIAHRVIPGAAEQRTEDATRRAQIIAQSQSRAAQLVQGETDETLLALAEQRVSLGRAGVIRATSGIGSEDLRREAAAEIERRHAEIRARFLPMGGEVVSGLTPAEQLDLARASAPLTIVTGAGRVVVPTTGVPSGVGRSTNPLSAPVAMGSVQPAGIKPVSGAAIRNQEAATGMRKELVGERADP